MSKTGVCVLGGVGSVGCRMDRCQKRVSVFLVVLAALFVDRLASLCPGRTYSYIITRHNIQTNNYHFIMIIAIMK